MGSRAKGRGVTARVRPPAVALMAMLTLAFGLPAAASQVVPAGGVTLIANGSVDLACTDLSVGGTLDTGTGSYVKVRDVTVGPAGVLQGNGTIRYSGTLTSSGVIGPGVILAANTECGGSSPIPTLSNWTLVALAGLLLCLSAATMSGRSRVRRRGEAKGEDK